MKSSAIFTKILNQFSVAFVLAGFVSLNAAPLPVTERKEDPDMGNFDKREIHLPNESLAETKAAARLRGTLPGVIVEHDGKSGGQKFITSPRGFLSGANGSGGAISAAAAAAIPSNDPYRPVKAFLNEHKELFGYNAGALTTANIKRDDVTVHNGMRTVVWEQTLDELSVFEAVLNAHITAKGELINIGSGFVSDPAKAADNGTPNRVALQTNPTVSARQAVALAAQNVGVQVQPEKVSSVDTLAQGVEKKQSFTHPLLTDTSARLVWMPINADTLRLSWEVVLVNKSLSRMFLVVIDAQSGEALLRHSLTNDISDATYNVYASDSPSPMSPGLSTPSSTQPPLVSRTLITTPALNTTASPNGWINDGVFETLGNNVDAHTDTNADNSPDLPRPQSPTRVFDFPLDLALAPSAYKDAAVTQLFYWCNFTHDRLYDVGFTESAGNFQTNNFGRGGAGNDAVQADAQDGSGTNNANFSTPPDGSPGRMQMFVFTGPAPDRDGDLDAEIVIHEYGHGLSNRLVGGGVGISALQPRGMGEGWSDFYAMSLLSAPADNTAGNYATGGYATFQLAGLTENYYYGIRRYPYSTDISKSPLTFKDIDPGQASAHAGIPRSPIIGNTANEVHNMGEVWCVTLWEARANLIAKYGNIDSSNKLILQLVTDGMKFSPANPNFLQARDAIIQADLVNNGGGNRNELWAAFAKRGMGFFATSPSSATTVGVVESFAIPDDLGISPLTAFVSSGVAGGPFTVTSKTYTLANSGSSPLSWTAAATQSWLTLSATGGTLVAGASTTVDVLLNGEANNLSDGEFTDIVTFTNTTSGVAQNIDVSLSIGLITVGTGTGNIPDGSGGTYGPPLVISFPVSGVSSNLTNVIIDVSLTHTWAGDVDLVLASPGGVRSLVLVSRLGVTSSGSNGSSSDYSGTYTFTDSAAGANIWTFGTNSFIPPGPYRTTAAGGEGQTNPAPITSLAVIFAGMTPAEANGTWTLTARDAVFTDIGTISSSVLRLTQSSPEIEVKDPVGGDLTDGISSVDLGSVLVNTSITKTFTIKNTGLGILKNLTITKDGTNESEFSITSSPVAPVGPGSETTFAVTFTPSASGSRTAAVHIANNDADENPFDITLTATGLAPEIEVKNPNGGDLTDGISAVGMGSTLVSGSITRTFTIKNTGNALLQNLLISKDGLNAGDFTFTQPLVNSVAGGASTTFTVTFKPTFRNVRFAKIHIANNDSDENPFDIALTGTGLAPEIEVRNPNGGIVGDGYSAVGMGATLVNNTITRTFTIKNIGNVNLNNLLIALDGLNSSDFTFTQPLVNSVAGGASTTFTVTFKPTFRNIRFATLHIANNDSDENPFDIALTGTGLAPEIEVRNPNGGNVGDGYSSVGMGAALLNNAVTRTFTINNIGNALLQNLLIAIDGVNSGDFTFTQPLVNSVAGGAGTTFTVTFKPTFRNVRFATLHIANNDSDENPFDIALTGTGLAPEIDVMNPNGGNLADGFSTVGLGSVIVNTEVTRTFTIKNLGNALLKNLSIFRNGVNFSEFTVSQPLLANLAGGASTTFTVKFKPTSTGNRLAAIHIASNDSDENPFDIGLTGTGLAAAAPALASVGDLGSLLGLDSSGSEQESATGGKYQKTTTEEWVDGHKYLALAIKKPAGGLDSKLHVEVSPDRLDWYSGRNHTTVMQDDTEWLKVRDNTPLKPGTKRFIHLK